MSEHLALNAERPFSIAYDRDYKRLAHLRFAEGLLELFHQSTEDIQVSDIQRDETYAYVLSQELARLCGAPLRERMISILKSSDYGAVKVYLDGFKQANEQTYKVLAGLAGLLGRIYPEIDSAPGKSAFREIRSRALSLEELNKISANDFYRNPYTVFRLHTDGAHHDPPPDWVALAKLEPEFARGGATLLLHIDDWECKERFINDPLSYTALEWVPPGAFCQESLDSLRKVGIRTRVISPLFSKQPGGAAWRFVKRPHNCAGGIGYSGSADQESLVKEMDCSVHDSKNVATVHLEPGSILFVNNLKFLHGRAAFHKTPTLSRVVVRVRGLFNAGVE